MRLTLPLATGIRFTNVGRHLVAISPNGSRVVYAANNQLYLQRLDGGPAAPIPGLGGQETAVRAIRSFLRTAAGLASGSSGN